MMHASVLNPEDGSLAGSEEKAEIATLLHGIHSRYGYDFTHYSQASLKRRLERALSQAKLTHYTELLDRLFHEERSFDEFLKIMSVTVTEMFRDPPFYRAIREQVVPLLKTYPFNGRGSIFHGDSAA
jgi:chemotaxis protein methyltransferase CheR